MPIHLYQSKKVQRYIGQRVYADALQYPDDGGVIFNGACLFAVSGEKEKAISLLQVAVDKGWGNKEWIEQDSDYDSLREEPQFKALMKKLEEKYT